MRIEARLASELLCMRIDYSILRASQGNGAVEEHCRGEDATRACASFCSTFLPASRDHLQQRRVWHRECQCCNACAQGGPRQQLTPKSGTIFPHEFNRVRPFTSTSRERERVRYFRVCCALSKKHFCNPLIARPVPRMGNWILLRNSCQFSIAASLF